MGTYRTSNHQYLIILRQGPIPNLTPRICKDLLEKDMGSEWLSEITSDNQFARFNPVKRKHSIESTFFAMRCSSLDMIQMMLLLQN